MNRCPSSGFLNLTLFIDGKCHRKPSTIFFLELKKKNKILWLDISNSTSKIHVMSGVLHQEKRPANPREFIL